MTKISFIMLVGLPASGKSFAAKEFNFPVVSSDELREELFGDVNDQTHNKEVFEEVGKRVCEYLKNGQSCVLDATNLSRKKRKAFLRNLPKTNYEIEKTAIVICTEIGIVLEQNSKRERHVPEEVIMRMYKSMTMPRKDEGWDNILFKAHEENIKKPEDYLVDCFGIEHDNPHHPRDIYHHMFAAHRWALNNFDIYGLTKNEASVASLAALFHDIGKPLVKSRVRYNGKVDDHSHYYNHAEIGAYMIACCGNQFAEEYSKRIWEQLIILIQWHMDFYSPDRYSLTTFKNLHGERLEKILEFVNYADKKNP